MAAIGQASGTAPPGQRAPAVPSTHPAAAGDGIPALRALLDGGPLLLSNDGRSATDRFHFAFLLRTSGPDGKELGMVANVVRDRDRSAVVVTSLDGTCYAYMTDGLFVSVDPDEPGGLAFMDHGSPDFVFASAADGQGVDMELSQGPATGKTRILLDIGSILKAAVPQIADSRYDAEQRIVTYHTARAEGQVQMADARHAATFGVKEMVVKATAGPVLAASLADSLKADQDFFGVTRQSVEGLGLHVRRLAAGSDPVTVFPPPQLGTDEKMRAAAAKLASLLPKLPGPDRKAVAADDSRQKLTEAVYATLDKVEALALGMALTAEERAKVSALVRARKAAFDDALADNDAGRKSPQDVAAAARSAVDTDAAVRAALGDEKTGELARRWRATLKPASPATTPAPATSPSPATRADGQLGRPDGSPADAGRAEAAALVVRVRAALAGVEMNADHRRRADAFVAGVEATLAAADAGLADGSLTPAEASARRRTALDLGDRLRAAIGDDAYVAFANRWAALRPAATPASRRADPFLDQAVPVLASAIRRVQMTEEQRRACDAALARAVERYELAVKQATAGGIGAADLKRFAGELTSDFVAALKQALSPDQYRELEKRVYEQDH